MNRQRHLLPRVLAIAGLAAAVSLSAALVTPAGAEGGLENIEANASANAPAVRMTTTTTTKPPATTAPKLPTVPALLMPVPCGIPLKQFGTARSGGRTHEGEDIAAPQNTPVLAVVSGTLYRQVKVGDSNASLSGNALYLRDDATNAYYFYAHLDHFADLPIPSQVTAGQVIGYVGDTGNPGPGNYHLHFEVHPNGNAYVVNPLPYLSLKACPKA